MQLWANDADNDHLTDWQRDSALNLLFFERTIYWLNMHCELPYSVYVLQFNEWDIRVYKNKNKNKNKNEYS